MNFFNRAIKNITRKTSKSILLILTFFVIGNFVIVGLGISKATENAKILTRQKMRAVVTYGVDYDKVNKYVQGLTDEDEIEDFYNKFPSPKLGEIKEILKDERVKTANAIQTTMLYSDGELDFVHLNNRAEENMNNDDDSYGIAIMDDNMQETRYIEPTFSLKANYFPDMIEFVDGGYEISEGRFYNQNEIDSYKNVCLITNALASQNNLHIGDKITVYYNSPSDLSYFSEYGVTKEDLIMELEIIGLYEPGYHIMPDSSQFEYTSPYENPDNMIMMPASSLYASQLVFSQKQYDYYKQLNPDELYYQDDKNRPTLESIDNTTVYDVTLLLNDPLDVDPFIKEYSDNLGEFLRLDANNDEFKRLSKPLDTLNDNANFIVWLVVINAIVIITLVTALTLKTREYEIGVLLSIGASKLKVIGQFFVELAIVALIGFSIATISGSIVSEKIGKSVLEHQIVTDEISDEDDFYNSDYISIWNNDYTSKIKLEDIVDKYKVEISPFIIIEIYILGLAIVLISILVPSMMIMRFNPKKILMNQN